MTDEIKIGNIVVFKDQSKNLREKCILGGVVIQIIGDSVVLHRWAKGYKVYLLAEVRNIEAKDVGESGIDVL